MTKYVNNNGVSEMWLNIKNWVTSQLLGYSQTGHTHTKSQITDLDLSNYVDKISNQTVAGQKIFTHGATGLGRDSYHFATIPYGKNTPPANTSYQYVFFSGNTASQGFTNSWYGGFIEQVVGTDGSVRGRWLIRRTDETSASVELLASADNTLTFRPTNNNVMQLGDNTRAWKNIHSNAYYLGNTAFGNIVTHNASEFAQVGHTHSASEITDLETWNYDSNSDSIIVSGGTDTWSYDSQSNSIIVS